MPRLLLLLLLSAAACTTQPGPGGDNPIALAAVPGADAATAPPDPSTAWKQVDAVDISTGLKASVTTSAVCCDGQDPVDGSPARFFLALAAPGSTEGYVLYVDAEDHVVLAGQEEPGKYTIELYRSEEKALRAAGTVTLTVPATGLPTGPLLLWAGTRQPSSVNGVALPNKSEDGSIPTLRLDGPNDVPITEVNVRPISPQRPPDPEGRPPEGDLPPDPEGRPPEGDLPPDPEGRSPEGEPPPEAVAPEDLAVEPPTPPGDLPGAGGPASDEREPADQSPPDSE